MKSSSQTQSTSTHPTNLTSSILQALSGIDEDENSPVLPIIMTNTSPESDALQQRRRLRRILDSAIALIDSDDFDPIESSTTPMQPLP
jgi:hypothetical protein